MPLTDLVRTLNSSQAILPKHYARSGLDHPFVAADGRVFLHYANIRLESQFRPIVEAGSGKLHGHAAALQAFGMSSLQPLTPEAVFVLPTDDDEFVYLDRLVRTLHALNYLTQPKRGNLLLKVHARHVISVPAHHGLAFEEILKPCGLVPDQITLEIDISKINDTNHLLRAIDSYRSRGYAIVISTFGRRKLDYATLRALQPDIVKLDSRFLASGPTIGGIVETLRHLPGSILIEDAEAVLLSQLSSITGRELLQVSSREIQSANESWHPSSGSVVIRNAA